MRAASSISDNEDCFLNRPIRLMLLAVVFGLLPNLATAGPVGAATATPVGTVAAITTSTPGAVSPAAATDTPTATASPTATSTPGTATTTTPIKHIIIMNKEN